MPSPLHPTVIDPVVATVEARLRRLVEQGGMTQQGFWSRLIRQGLDEVIDGPRTGRWAVRSLEKTEKTYIGTKMEILVRSELELPRGVRADLSVDGIDVDVKWSLEGGWMIGPENVDTVCLGLSSSEVTSRFSVGVFRASDALLTRGGNRDGKRQLTAEAKRTTTAWLIQNGALPVNLLSTLDPTARALIFAGGSAQERVRLLAKALPGIPLSRQVIATVAGNKMDPMRRLRRDKYRSNPLGDMVLLHTSQGRRQLLALNFTDLPRDHWIAVPETDLLGLDR